MTITLFTAETSIGWASHIALEESGLEYEASALDFSQGQQSSADYLQINAKARVPALKVDQGVITETPAILTYIAQMAPTSSLALPDDPFEQAMISAFNLYLCSTVHVAHAHKHRGTRWVDDERALKLLTDNVPKTMAVCANMIESHMFKGPWVHGEKFSISDPYLYRITSWFDTDGVDITQYPKLKAHRDAMNQRESVKAVKAFFSAN